MTAPLLDVRDLSVQFGRVAAVQRVSFTLQAGETLAIVGESSSGKSVTALALMRLLDPPPICRISGQAWLQEDGARTDLLALSENAMRARRGRQLAMIFQEPMSSLNPVHRVGAQIIEALRQHEPLSVAAARSRAIDLLAQVGIPAPSRRLDDFPHHLSGGMRQRVMIAMALACHPRILIADEPTTALDVTIQAQILELLARLQQDTGMAVIFITHNLGVVAQVANRVLVMYGGQMVEEAPVATLLRQPLMPYSAGLLRSVPRMQAALTPGLRLPAIPGNVPDPAARPPGCVFHPRCQHARPDPCAQIAPELAAAAADHHVRCHLWQEIAA